MSEDPARQAERPLTDLPPLIYNTAQGQLMFGVAGGDHLPHEQEIALATKQLGQLPQMLEESRLIRWRAHDIENDDEPPHCLPATVKALRLRCQGDPACALARTQIAAGELPPDPVTIVWARCR